MSGGKGLTIDRYFSRGGDFYKDPTNIAGYQPRTAEITSSSGEIVESLDEVIFPSYWTQNSSNTVATKYFRREDVPGTGRETDIRQLAGRVAKTVASWGLKQGHLNEENAKNLEHELLASTVFQYGAFNSPVWFNLGLDRYGIKKQEETYYVDVDGKIKKPKNYFEHPQVSACFISSPEDSIPNMVDVGAVISSKIFKRGSGIGGDWSHVRSSGEPVSGGGYASGAKRFMDLQDSAGRVIKSGGISRRAATMQSIGIWHPDAIPIIIDKYKEEEKARILVDAGSPRNWEGHTIQDLRSQNVNISLRVDDEFWEACEKGELYSIRNVLDGQVVKEVPAKDLLEMISYSTHGCGDPGIQNHTIINKWNTCKNSGDIWASNPCSEYMFLNNSACNLSSLNLMRFRMEDGNFDIKSFCNAVDLYITSQDILVSQASYPTKDIARNSDIFRPLGLGYANLGALIMSKGIPYDSDEARNLASAITSLMTAQAYLQSTKLAEELGSFKEFEKNKEPMMEVIRMHQEAAKNIPKRSGLEEIVEAANEKWEEVIRRGGEYGFRNAQVTLLAPTGTIGFMMGCDTTGCEPELALKKSKELSGGGNIEIVNQTVEKALRFLDCYNDSEITEVLDYINENGTIEGCEVLRDEHIPIFDCSISSGVGERVISPEGHIRMLGAIQPHISGAISKSINCPERTTVEEIAGMYYLAWKEGIKAIAIYRDGSKVSQPLTTEKKSKLEIISREQREPLPSLRYGITQKVKLGGFSLFVRTGEYQDGRLGEIFVDSLERGSETNRLLSLSAIQLSEKLQYGVPLEEAIEILGKAGQSQISGNTDHPFIKEARGVEGFLHSWIRAHYLGDISFVLKEPESRPLPHELRVYQQVPELHLFPTVMGEKFYPDVPSLEETIERISGMNYWEDFEDGLDTRKTLEKIKRTRDWENEGFDDELSGKITGRTCDCGGLMVSDGSCWKCPSCKISTGGCGGG